MKYFWAVQFLYTIQDVLYVHMKLTYIGQQNILHQVTILLVVEGFSKHIIT